MTKLTLKEIKQKLILDILHCDGLAVLASSAPSSDPDKADISVRFTGESLAEIADLVARIVIALGTMSKNTFNQADLPGSDFNVGLAAVLAAYDLMSTEEASLNTHLH